MPVQTRYYRSDTQVVNGRNGYKLATTQSSSYAVATSESGLISINVIKRTSAGIETTIASGVASYSVPDYTNDTEVSATWSCPQTALNATDCVVVYETNPGVTFISEQLGASQLNASTWTVYRNVTFDPEASPAFYLYFGSSARNSRITGFSITTGGSQSLAAAVAGGATVSAATNKTAKLAAAVSASSSDLTSIAALKPLAASLSCASQVAVMLVKGRSLSFSAAGTCAVSVEVGEEKALDAQITGTSIVAASLNAGATPLNASIHGQASVSLVVFVKRGVSATAACAASASAGAKLERPFFASVAGSATVAVSSKTLKVLAAPVQCHPAITIALNIKANVGFSIADFSSAQVQLGRATNLYALLFCSSLFSFDVVSASFRSIAVSFTASPRNTSFTASPRNTSFTASPR